MCSASLYEGSIGGGIGVWLTFIPSHIKVPGLRDNLTKNSMNVNSLHSYVCTCRFKACSGHLQVLQDGHRPQCL